MSPLLFSGVVLLLASFTGAVEWTWDMVSPLDEYIANWDVPLNYEQLTYHNYTQEPGMECDMYVLNFTSQHWMSRNFSSQDVWFHHLLVAIPTADRFWRRDTGFMYIEGGGNNNNPVGPDNEFFNYTCRMAVKTGGVGGMVRQIPNQAIRYVDDPEQRNRTEDANIAYTWRHFIDNPDTPEKILQFPMTKGASRALDVINAFTKEKFPDSDINRFAVTGGSKRGWITWLLGATDRRVVFMAPMVLTCLNSILNFEHHFRALGGWSYVVNDYYDAEIFKEMYNPNLQLMFDHVDPYSYRLRMTIPKLVIAATGDEFFLTDDSHYFFDDLPEPKFFMMNQNTNHPLIGHYERIFTNQANFYNRILDDQPLPQVNWTKNMENETHGWLEMWTKTPVRDIVAYAANTVSSVRRDFRLSTANGTQAVLWVDRPVRFVGGDFQRGYWYRVEIEKRADDFGWRGFLINAQIPSTVDMEDFDVTTEASIMEDYLPFPPCVPDECNKFPLV